MGLTDNTDTCLNTRGITFVCESFLYIYGYAEDMSLWQILRVNISVTVSRGEIFFIYQVVVTDLFPHKITFHTEFLLISYYMFNQS